MRRNNLFFFFGPSCLKFEKGGLIKSFAEVLCCILYFSPCVFLFSFVQVFIEKYSAALVN